MCAGMSLIGLVDATAKVLAQDLPGIQVAWGYFAGMFVSLLAWLIASQRKLTKTWRTARPGLQWIRAICIVGSLCLLFTSLAYLPLAEATVISFTAPLIIVALAGPVLGETVGWARWAAVIAGMAGALLVIRPGTEVFHWAALLPLGGAVFFACFSLATRAIGMADSVFTTLLYTAGGSALLLLPPMWWLWKPPTITQWSTMLLFGAMGLGAHLLIARSLQLAPASTLAPLNYVRVVWAVGLGYLWFGNIPDTLSIIGGLIVVGSGLFAVLNER